MAGKSSYVEKNLFGGALKAEPPDKKTKTKKNSVRKGWRSNYGS